MFYPGTSLYEKALKAGVIDDNYIDEVLLTRRTLRRPTEIDLDRIILGFFRVSIRSRFWRCLMLLGHAPLVLRLVGTYPVRKVIYWLYFGLANQKKPHQLKLAASQTYNPEAGGWVSRWTVCVRVRQMLRPICFWCWWSTSSLFKRKWSGSHLKVDGTVPGIDSHSNR